MSSSASLLRRLGVAAVLACAAASADAGAAQRLESFALPSPTGNVIASKVKLNGGVTSLRATVLLPDGYDDAADRTYPVLYLLHGAGDNTGTWAQRTKGDIARTAEGFPGIIVMPESGQGWFTDWWQSGTRSGPRWTRYMLDDVLPAIESRYRIAPGRRNHAIAGLSMGASGALFLAGQLPGYFGTTVAMSGLLDTQVPSSLFVALGASGAPYDTIWGSILGNYAAAHNPVRTIPNVARSRVYVASGNGVPDLSLPVDPGGWTIGSAAEVRVSAATYQYAAAAALQGVETTLRVRTGVHAWPYWRRELTRAIAWNLFAPPPTPDYDASRSWQYITMEPVGNAWGIGYRFEKPTTTLTTFRRGGQTLSGSGTGTVTISPRAAEADASGAGTRPECSFTTTLPFSRTLPLGC